jgi:hypothetical protein
LPAFPVLMKGTDMWSGPTIQDDAHRQQRIDELRKKLEKYHPVETYVSPECPAEIEEKFLQNILAFEDAPPIVLFDELARGGVEMPPSRALGDVEVHGKLWEVIQAMTLLGCYLHSTDHLSDRELYELLWSELLREPTTLLPEDPNFACQIDIIGGFSEEDIRIYLRHYADEEARRDWAREFPEYEIPPHEEPPYDRDRYLPEPSIFQSNPTG